MPTEPGHEARGTAAGALASVAERVVSQLCQFAIFVLAARILGPADFGVFALVSACSLLLLGVAEAGWAPFIMSRSDKGDVPYQVVTVAVLCGIVAACVGAVGAQIGRGFGLPSELATLVQLFAAWIALATAYTAQKGVLTWLGRIKAAAFLEMAGELAGFVVAVLALMQGAGIFALIYGRLVQQVLTLALSFAVTRRAPALGMAPEIRSELWVFSGQFLVAQMLFSVQTHFLTLAIGAFLGPVTVGYFRAAERMVAACFELVAVPGELLAWQLLRRARDRDEGEGRAAARIRASVARQTKMLIALGAPLFLWLTIMHPEIVNGLLGPDWYATGLLVSILAMSRILTLPGVMTEPLLSMLGQARRLPGFTASIFGVSVTGTLVAAPFGAVPLAWSQIIVNGIILILTVRLFQRHAAISGTVLWAELRSLILPLGLGGVVIAGLRLTPLADSLPDLVCAASLGLLGAAIYAAALVLFDRPFWDQIVAALRPVPLPKGVPQ